MTPHEKADLLARALANDLSPAEAERLCAACREDEALLAELSRLAMFDRLLAHAHLYPDGPEFAREVDARLRMRSAGPSSAGTFSQGVAQRLRWTRTRGWRGWQGWRAPGRTMTLLAATVVIAVAAGAWWMVTVAHRPVASVVRVEAMTWADGQRRLSTGDRLRAERVRIASGFLELEFTSGVRLILEGPAELALEQGNGAFLHRGRAVARVPKAARGFVLDSPRGRLVDLGTEFGVSVGEKSDVEVHVLKGLVEAMPASQRAPLRLQQNEAARMVSGGVSRMPSNALEFVTDLPSRHAGPVGFVHWSFDEGEGERTRNRGHGLGPADADAVFHRFTPASREPEWTTGQFGSGVYLDGEGAFLDSPFTGIEGDHPRTVAFWVKVPRDLGPWQGYGILNWGSLAEPGAAWQISVNPEPWEGPVGHLRVGVHNGPVVGITDLRDGRWHHCAVVMYGGHRPDVSTHVLLFLDGELEPTATKAVREIHTDTTSAKAHGIWIGRNISFKDASESEKRHRFFRGWLDEVFIFDVALTQEQIRHLMRENGVSPPPS